MVAVLNFLWAFLCLACGGVMLMAGGLLWPNSPDEVTNMFKSLLVVLAVASFVIASPLFAAGCGLVARREWGRILSLILGGISGFLALLSAVNQGYLGAVFYGGYFVTAYVVLLQRRYAAEFR
jgi:hypothetical protein